MKDTNFLNLFWGLVWGLIVVLAVVGIFWKPAIYVVAVLAAVMFGIFLHDFIRFIRMK